MPIRELPPRPNLEQYKKQAKDLVKSVEARAPEAIDRVRQHHPRLAFADPNGVRVALADAQWVIAREHGFASWSTFAHHVETLANGAAAHAIWGQAQSAIVAGDADHLQRLLDEHRSLFRTTEPPPYVPRGPRPDYSTLNARAIVAQEHDFADWNAFTRFAEALNDPLAATARFEHAVDAVVIGDLDKLRQLLLTHPDLAQDRSSRRHRSSLLHYVGANGVEAFRQRTPPNAATIAALLLDYGADIDATADMYGGNARTLGLVATSIHPKLAGIQEDLMELLITRGASIVADASIVNGCLANGRDTIAAVLVARGAPLDLEGAAGLGRLDAVRTFFDTSGGLAATATTTQLLDGFSWACEYGHTDVVEFLLDCGVDVDSVLKPHHQTGLHWAALGGHTDLVERLLARGAQVDVMDGRWGTTPLMWCLYRWSEEDGRNPRQCGVARRLVDAGAAVRAEWLIESKVRSDAAMVQALTHSRRD